MKMGSYTMKEKKIKDWINSNLFTKNEVIKKYNITSANFDNYIRRGKIKPFIKKSPRINLYLRKDIELFLERSKSTRKTNINDYRRKEHD